jgi:AbiV family abortive infection protein
MLAMSDTRKRQYRSTLDFIEHGFRACWRNANDLSAASKKLIDHQLHAPGLSLAVLALEEIGKLCAMDGLLFAGSDDHKLQRFGKSQRDHDTKLTALTLLPMFIHNLSLVDPRRPNKQPYAQAMANTLSQLKQDGNAVLRPIQQEGFVGLNRWKQRGFYVSSSQNAFVAPREAVDPTYAETVCHFAWRAVTSLDFVLKEGNLERYISQARSIRSKLAGSDHQAFEQAGQRLADILFAPNKAAGDEPEVLN